MANVMRIVMMPFLLVVMSACQPAAAVSVPRSEAPEVDRAAQRRPPFILAISPSEQTRISVNLFVSDLRPQYAAITGAMEIGALRRDAIGHNASVCARLDFATLVRDGDDLLVFDTVAERVVLRVNGVVRPEIVDYSYVPILMQTDGARWGGPTTICWRAALEAGVQEAEVGFRLRTGGLATYRWQFELIDD